MGVYLPNMELPKAYGPHVITVTLFVRGDGTASLWGKEVFIPHEPLEVVSVPPHGDLIDRNELSVPYDICDGEEAMEFIKAAPIIIPASEEG